MRVLSFIPAVLLAAASFVAAAPTGPVDTSCVAPPPGNDAPLHGVIEIIAHATTQMQPLSVQLANLHGDSCTPEAVSNIVVEISGIVNTCVTQLQATAHVDLSGLDLDRLVATISDHLSVVLEVLNTLVTIVFVLRTHAVGALQTVICNLLDAVVHLLGCLRTFVGVSIAGSIGPVIATVNGVVTLLLSIVVNLNVVIGTH